MDATEQLKSSNRLCGVWIWGLAQWGQKEEKGSKDFMGRGRRPVLRGLPAQSSDPQRPSQRSKEDTQNILPVQNGL